MFCVDHHYLSVGINAIHSGGAVHFPLSRVTQINYVTYHFYIVYFKQNEYKWIYTHGP